MVDRSSPPAPLTPRDVAGVPSRRALLTAASLAPLALLTACRVRLEDDAPRVPLIPTREPTEDEALLLAAWRASTDLGRMTTGLAGDGVTASRLHAVQARTFDQVLRDRRVPDAQRTSPAASPTASSTAASSAGSTVSAAATGSSASAASSAGSTVSAASSASASASAVSTPNGSTPNGSTPTAPPDRTAVARAEAGAVSPAALAELATAHAGQLPLLASFAACRARLAAVLGAPPSWPAWGETASPADAGLLAAHRRARYHLEVAAARTPAEARAPFARELDRVAGVVVRLESRGASTGAPPAGYPLPFPVRDAAAARRLVTHALTTLETACGTTWSAGSGSSEAVTTTTRLVVDTVTAGAAWGVPLRAFPGLAS
ncbi:DUF4439 domain-containing protein [Arsenicicoccus bolidensis]|uniref:Ferritin-like domain-containing protein n=2 Tax=Arsenicicoccus TaxID=267408 RepID=A0ABS9PYE8_9MICO|nr:DUF4439 domain-containing protein [Arsenicicoccus bolidensis]MCG7320656.1 ferritin-like domain-containing protein [Arsenicicoccus bolidensis]